MISIIVPIYNTCLYVEDCIKSVLAQTYGDFELLLVDNGSTDGSGEICEKYSDTDRRVTVLHKPHGSISSARNLGIENASGDYLAFVDSDDLLEKDALQCLYTAATDQKADIAIIKAKRMYTDKTEQKNDTDKITFYDKKESLNAWLCRHEFGAEVWGKLFKADTVKGIVFPEQRCEDMVYLFEAIKKSSKNVLADRHLYLYRMHRKSVEASAYRRPVEDEKVDVLETMLEYIKTEYPEQYGAFFGAATNSIFGSVMRIYAADKTEQQSVYLHNSDMFFKKNKKTIGKSSFISRKNKLLIRLYCANKTLFGVVFRLRNKIS